MKVGNLDQSIVEVVAATKTRTADRVACKSDYGFEEGVASLYLV